MFWAWRAASGVDDSGVTRYSFAGAGYLPCGLLAGLERSFVFLLCIGVLSSLLGCMPGVANAHVSSNHSLARLKSGTE